MLAAAAALSTLAFLPGCKRDYAGDAQLYRSVLDQTPAPTDAASNLPHGLTHKPTPTHLEESQVHTPLLLSDALALVNRRNENLAIEGEVYVQSILQKKRDAADFLPTLSISPAYGRNEGLSGARRNRNDEYRDRVDVPIDLSWNIFDGFRDVAALYRNAATVRQREALLRDLEQSLMLDVVNTFYEVLRAERSIRVLESSLDVQEERVRDISARREAGIARPLDVAQTEAVASEARVSLIDARQFARNARLALALLLDTPILGRPLQDDILSAPAEQSLEHWHAVALSSRMDLQAATAGVVAAEHEIQNAFGQYYPSVTLDLQYLLTFNHTASETGWNAILRAYVPIFSAGRIEADVRIAWSQLRQAVLFEAYTQRLIAQQVMTTHGNWLASVARLRELHRKLEAAQIAYEQADSSYNVGLATNLERLDAQDRLLLTELEIANEDYLLKQNFLNFLRAIGKLDGSVIAQARLAAADTVTTPQPPADTFPRNRPGSGVELEADAPQDNPAVPPAVEQPVEQTP